MLQQPEEADMLWPSCRITIKFEQPPNMQQIGLFITTEQDRELKFHPRDAMGWSENRIRFSLRPWLDLSYDTPARKQH